MLVNHTATPLKISSTTIVHKATIIRGDTNFGNTDCSLASAYRRTASGRNSGLLLVFISAGTWPSDLFIEHGTYFMPANPSMKSTHQRPDFAKGISRFSLYFYFRFMILHGPSAYDYRQSGGFWPPIRG